MALTNPGLPYPLAPGLRSTSEHISPTNMLFSLRISVLAATIAAAAANCPTSEWKQYGSMCYWVSDYVLNWHSVDHVCDGTFPGSTSVSIHDLELDAFLANELLDGKVAWLGLRRATTSSSWVWSDGSLYDFSLWYSGQPDNSGESCVLINDHSDSFGTWADRVCDSHYLFMCQIPA